jgi:hypothetical protein
VQRCFSKWSSSSHANAPISSTVALWCARSPEWRRPSGHRWLSRRVGERGEEEEGGRGRDDSQGHASFSSNGEDRELSVEEGQHGGQQCTHLSGYLPLPPFPMVCPAPPHMLTNIVAPSLMGLINVVVVVLSWLWLPLTSVCQGRMQRRKGCRGCHPTGRHYLVLPGVIAMMKTPPHTRDSTAYCH